MLEFAIALAIGLHRPRKTAIAAFLRLGLSDGTPCGSSGTATAAGLAIRPRATIPAGASILLRSCTRPERRLPTVAARTRIVLPGRNSAGSPEICATFQR